MSYGNYAPFYRGGYFNPMQAPMAEQQPYQAPIQPAPIPAQQNNGMLFVLNENEASSYPVAPNNSVVLWDRDNKTFYIKTANAQGIPSMQVYDFTERAEIPKNEHTEHKCTCGERFVTKEVFEEFKTKIEGLINKQEDENNG